MDNRRQFDEFCKAVTEEAANYVNTLDARLAALDLTPAQRQQMFTALRRYWDPNPHINFALEIGIHYHEFTKKRQGGFKANPADYYDWMSEI